MKFSDNSRAPARRADRLDSDRAWAACRFPPPSRAGLAWPRCCETRGRALIAVDFDGTLAPIVADPAQARALPAAVAALRALTPLVGTMAVLTGRPALIAVRVRLA